MELLAQRVCAFVIWTSLANNALYRGLTDSHSSPAERFKGDTLSTIYLSIYIVSIIYVNSYLSTIYLSIIYHFLFSTCVSIIFLFVSYQSSIIHLPIYILSIICLSISMPIYLSIFQTRNREKNFSPQGSQGGGRGLGKGRAPSDVLEALRAGVSELGRHSAGGTTCLLDPYLSPTM